MAERYTLKIVTDFAAAHTLQNYPGACSRMHGHNWKVEAEVVATELDEIGMGIDFKEIKRATRAITDELDHRYLNELEPFKAINPTAEHIARYLFNALANALDSATIKVQAITLWETDRACVRYTRD